MEPSATSEHPSQGRPIEDATRDLEQQLTEATKLDRRVFRWSGGRKYCFYWLKKAHRLAVKIYPPRYARNPALETLAKQLQIRWSCPHCGVEFERQGKQRYCTAAHAATARVRKWRKRQQEQLAFKAALAGHAERQRHTAEVLKRNEVLRRKRKPTLKSRKDRLTTPEREAWS